MNILITGTSGFLGKTLLKRLIAENLNFICLTRSSRDAADIDTNRKIRVVQADVLDLDSLNKIKREIKSIDRLIHLAALVPRDSSEDKARLMCKFNTEGTINILEAFGKEVKGIIYISTIEVYGLPNSTLINENLPVQPLTFYAASKLAGEKFGEVFATKNNVILTTLRLSTLYGPGDTINRAVPNFIKAALLGKPLIVYGGEQLRDYLHVEDAAEAIYLALKNPLSGIFNIGSSKGIRIKEVAKVVINKINLNLKIRFMSLSKKDANIVVDIGKARRWLGFKPKFFFPEKLDEEIEWIRKNL